MHWKGNRIGATGTWLHCLLISKTCSAWMDVGAWEGPEMGLRNGKMAHGKLQKAQGGPRENPRSHISEWGDPSDTRRDTATPPVSALNTCPCSYQPSVSLPITPLWNNDGFLAPSAPLQIIAHRIVLALWVEHLLGHSGLHQQCIVRMCLLWLNTYSLNTCKKEDSQIFCNLRLHYG